MPRPKKFPDYNADKIQKELIKAVVESYEETGELKITANEFSLSPLKIRKMLITAGVYWNEVSDEVNELYRQGKTVQQIMEITGLKKSSVNGYLPYSKIIYKSDIVSMNAARIQVYRKRKVSVELLNNKPDEDTLWSAITAFQDYPFHTFSGLPFLYKIPVGRKGILNRELWVDRRDKSKSLTWSSVLLAYEKVRELDDKIVEKPKDIGDIRGISYIYPIFYRFGLIDVPEKIAARMELKTTRKYVYEYMMKNGCRIGGEQSGHIIFSKYASTGDGILTSLKIMEVMMARKRKLSELAEGFTVYPQVLTNVRVTDKKAAQDDADVQAAVKKVTEELGDTGRILVRESGTEPVVRVMVEAESEEICQKYVDMVVNVIKENGYVAG